jgi:hypothetical protein
MMRAIIGVKLKGKFKALDAIKRTVMRERWGT